MDMKRYAVFAKRSTDSPRAEGDHTIWYFLNDTDDADEAFYWYYHAKNNNDQYSDVQIVEAIYMEATKI